jgi:hypothetical protein
VDALAADGQGHIYAVVDEQRHIVPARDLMQLPGFCHQLPRVARLLAELDDSDAPLDRRLDDGIEVAVAEDGGGRVGDQVQRVVDLWLAHCGLYYVTRIDMRMASTGIRPGGQGERSLKLVRDRSVGLWRADRHMWVEFGSELGGS